MFMYVLLLCMNVRTLYIYCSPSCIDYVHVCISYIIYYISIIINFIGFNLLLQNKGYKHHQIILGYHLEC